MELDGTRVVNTLNRLRAADAPVFGADTHRFLLNAPLREADVLNFEQHHKVRLPIDYRRFLISIGNGGAGPYYGIFPLGRMDSILDGGLEDWREQDGMVGVLSKPFPLESAWNDLSGKPDDVLRDLDEAEYTRQLDMFYEQYWNASIVDGAIPICHEGCALRIWLVVTGRQTGRLWHDGRADYTGLTPAILENGSPAKFLEWYSEWLEKAERSL